MKKLLYIFIFLFPLLALAQSQDKNYVKTRVYTKPSTEGNLTVDDTLVTVKYVDGLGRAIQTVAVGAGGDRQDIVTPVVYDPVTGKQTKQYLPYTDVNQTVNSLDYRPNENLVTDIENYYMGKFPGELDSNAPNPYSETFYEDSPINRVLKQAAPGEVWKGSTVDDNDHTIKFGYDTNGTNEVPDFAVTFPTGNTEEPQLTVNGYYEPWQLIKSTTKDENWTPADGNDKTTQEFIDFQGKTILKRTFNNGVPHDTYYVYDKYDNLTYVIPPLAADDIIIGDAPVIYSGINYPWVEIATVDAALAERYNRDLQDYDNAEILNVDLIEEYGGQGGFSIVPDDEGGVILNLNMAFSNPMELKTGSLIDLSGLGQFTDTELGRITSNDYSYVFLIQSNYLVIEGSGGISSVNTSLGATKLEYDKNYPWTALCQSDIDVATKYESDIAALDNADILSVYTPNQYGASGGIAVAVNENNAIILSINIASQEPLALKPGIAFSLDIQRRLTDRVLGTFSGNGYYYQLSLRDNSIYITGSGSFTQGSFSGTFNETNQPLDIRQEVVEGLCYIYHYDYRNRVVEKKIPGKGWKYMVYDKLNRVVMVQDQNLYTENKWLFTKYDRFNRVAYTGTVIDSKTRTEIQAIITAGIDNSISPPAFYSVNEIRKSSNTFYDGGLEINYSDSAYPKRSEYNSNQFTVLDVNYYDDYNYTTFPNNGTLPTATIYGESITDDTKMLPTGAYTRVLGTDNWAFSIAGYDKKARPVYTYTKNSYLNYNHNTHSKLNFIGAVTESRTYHGQTLIVNQGQSTASESITVLDYYTYDHMGRLLTHTQKEKNKPHEELIVYNEYDELGQLVQKKVGNAKGTDYDVTQGLQTVDYSFNIRGWLKGINDTSDNLEMNNDLFAFGINYNTADLLNTTTLYNGNISETHWKTKTDNRLRSYNYNYDALNRLTDANYHKVYTLPNNGLAQEDYTEGSIQYDKNGNILALERYGLKGIDQIDKIDDLAYIYENYSNTLTSVTDSGFGEGFSDGNTATDDYDYDANGNMTSDLNKGIVSIDYNHLNLPVKITKSGTEYIDYVYDATGQKLRKIVTDNGNTTITSYCAGFVYERSGTGDDAFQFFGTEEGYVTKDSNGDFAYIYQYKDHLGNVRLSYSDTDGDGIIADTQQFEDGFETAGTWMSSFNIERDNNHKYSGDYSGKIATSLLEPNKKSVESSYTMLINNDVATQYTISARVYTDGPEGQINLMMKTESGAWYVGDYALTGAIGFWVNISKTITVPADVRELKIRLDNNGHQTGGGYDVWFDEVKLYKTTINSEIISENHYYAFGMQHKGYNNIVNGGNAVAQNYTYNGKEMEDELRKDTYAYEWRDYDPAIARFLKIDRFAEKYYSLTPYGYAGNNPILINDIKGDSLWINYKGSRYLYEYDEENGGQLYTVASGKKTAYTGKIKGFLGKAFSSLNDLNKNSKTAAKILGEIQSSKFNVSVSHSRNNPNGNRNEFIPDNIMNSSAIGIFSRGGVGFLRVSEKGSGGTVYWDPKNGSVWELNKISRQTNVVTNLIHEFVHGWDAINGENSNNELNELSSAEWRAVYYENMVRRELGASLREYYSTNLNPNTGKYKPLPPRMLNSSNQPIFVAPPSLYLQIKSRF